MRVKAFLDANVLVSVLNKELPEYNYAARVLSLATNDRFELFTSSLCLAIGFYFSSKKSGQALARKKVSLLTDHLSIASINQSAVSLAIKDRKVHDLEDGFQNYAAQEAGCECIITANLKDYYFSELEVLTCEEFLMRKVVGAK